MIRRSVWAMAAAACAAFASCAQAREYAGLEGFYSSDADGTLVAKTALDLDFRHVDGEHYRGLSLEWAQFDPSGQGREHARRAFFRLADTRGGWKWNARIGSDGHTLLGNASVHNEQPDRQEYFIERDIVETPIGIRRGLYATTLGGAVDLPFGDRTVLTTVLGVQDFGGRNRRLQYRGNLIRVIEPAWGLSAQLRMRFFHDDVPNEFDYFSPRWYAQAMPTLQMRRYTGGWRYALAAGYGVQTTAGSPWRPARLLEASLTSPKTGHDWVFNAAFTYTNTPVASGLIYDYRQLGVSIGRAF